MHDYLLSSEWVRFAFVLGVAVSMVLYEKRHLTTGSIVVPGYIAVFIIHPMVIVATFVNAFITYAIVNLFLRRYFLLYGRTKFTLLAVISASIQTVMLRMSPSGQWLWEMDIPFFIGVGYIVPALIAHDMARQGVVKTTKSVLLAGSIVAIPIAIALALNLPGVNDLSPLRGFGSVAIDIEWLPLAVVLSVIASWAVAENYGLRSGGFVGSAFIGMFMADPWQVAVAVGIAIISYIIVAKFLMKHMILFGRRKFSAMLLVSSTIAWTGLWIGNRFLDATWQQHLGVGSLALTPLLLPGLLANDAQRTSPRHVVAGVTLAGTFVVTTTWWIQSYVANGWLHSGWKYVSAITFIVLFQKQMVTGARAGIVRIRRSMPASQPAAPVPTAAAASPVTPWPVWSELHPNAAIEAEAWLDAQLAKLTLTAPALSGVGAGTSFDLTATTVLEDALVGERGMRPVPRRATQISGTFDAPREAQLAASDVPDNTPTPIPAVASTTDNTERPWASDPINALTRR